MRVLLISAVLLLSATPIVAQPPAGALGFANRTMLSVGDVSLYVYYGNPLVYALTPEPRPGLSPIIAAPLRVKIYTTATMVQQRFVKVGSETVEIMYRSSEPTVATVKVVPVLEEAWVELTGRQGRATIVVAASQAQTEIPLDVRVLPIRTGQSADEVVKILGVPDRIDKISVRFPERVVVNGISYAPRLGSPISVDHWIYNNLPGAVLAMSPGTRVFQIYTQLWGIY